MATSGDPEKSEILKGTLDMLILRTLTVQPMHGYAIAQQIHDLSDGVLTVEQGSLYPALQRLQKKGWATSRWSESPTGRKRVTTPSPRRVAGDSGMKISSFDRVLMAIQRVMEGA